MNWMTQAWRWLTEEPLQTRSIDSFTDHPGLTEQLAAAQGLSNRVWRAASIREAMGIPSIQRAVALVSNTTGLLSVQGFRNGALMPESPRLVARPDPFSTPREFYRDTAYHLATRGEAVWWIAARDNDNLAASLIVVPLAELRVDANERNRAFPVYSWGKIESYRYSPATPNGDFVHLTYLKEPGQLRGSGPLQMCGAAVSVTVEAQQWAANFFAGDPSMTELASQVDLDEAEANLLVDQWMEKQRSNLPRVTTPSVEWKEHQIDPQSAQMTEARNHQDGEAARMFGIPGSLLEYSSSGSSLTYQNVEQEYTKFVRTCLSPNYLEPIEQAMTDLLPRSTVAQFNVEGLLRADIKTRFEVYKAAIEVFGLDEGARYAREREGLAPGNIERAPVPFAAPSAIPSLQERSVEIVTDPSPARIFAEAMAVLATREQPAPVVTVHSAPITVEAQPVHEQAAPIVNVLNADLEPLREQVSRLHDAMTAPKELIRDEAGHITGVKGTVQ